MNLSKREINLLKILAIIISLSLIYLFVISPIINLSSESQNEFNNSKQKVLQLNKIYLDYNETKRKIYQYKKLMKNDSGITSLIEDNAKKTNILENKVYTRDRPITIKNKYLKIITDVKFESVNMKSMINFLYLMENSNKSIKVSYLRIRSALKGKMTYDVIIKFVSYKLK